MAITLGTCSWTDPSLIKSGRFYPVGVKTPEARLRYYAGIFPTVEVDTSYYAVPEPRTAIQWAERTPEQFSFHVKAFRLLTGHWADLKVLPPDLREAAAPHTDRRGRLYLKDLPGETKDALWSAFEAALAPLRGEGKLGTVLFQFAPWVPPSKRVYEHIEECKARLPGYQLAIEFRNKAWFERGMEETLGFLRRHELIYAAVDEPQGFSSSVPPVVDVTGPGAYVRFHGRNRDTWEKRDAKTSAERFDYWYAPEELAEWVPRLEFLEREAGDVSVLFNTNNEDQGPENARRLAAVLTDAGLG
ncbi:MAG: DUF72 domain-containing protein, partial [Dehalococcoidia bacterium]